MARRPKSKQRREQRSDPLEALRPLVVLGLLGMILYGAYSIIQKGPQETAPAWQQNESTATSAAPPFVPNQPTPPAVELAATTPPVVNAATPAPPPPAAASPFPPAAVAAPAAISAAAAVTATPGNLPGTESAAPPSSLAADAPRGDEMPPTYIDAVAAAPPKPATDTAATTTTSLGAEVSAHDSAAFTAAWADAHNKLEAGRYAEALAILSIWYDDASLSAEEGRQLETLLGQLAGTVIYSTQDMLLPPHITAPGETLESIASPLNVPWKLLAKINGVGPEGPLPGQAIKVVRGPFDAVVSVSRRRLSLQVGGRYAGSFAAAIGSGFATRSGSSVQFIEVQRASSEPATATVPVAYQPTARPAIVLSDGLRIEPAAEPGFVASSPADQVLLISIADFADLADILGPGSQLLVRQ